MKAISTGRKVHRSLAILPLVLLGLFFIGVVPQSPAEAQDGSAVRSISGTTVTIVITAPTAGVSVWGAEDYIPTGLEYVDGSVTGSNGAYDEGNRKVSWWGLGTSMPATVGYQVTGPDGTYVITGGQVSFDGPTQLITGDDTIIIPPPGEGELPEGELPEGELPEGELPEGELPEGELPEGELPEGELPEGELPEGELPEGEVPEGELPEGELPEGELPEGELPEGELPEGELPEGELPEGELPEGELPEGEPVEGEAPCDAVRTITGLAVTIVATPIPGTTVWGAEDYIPTGLEYVDGSVTGSKRVPMVHGIT